MKRNQAQEQLIKRKKFVYLCTNAVLMEKKLHDYKPSPYFTWSVHLDGLKEDIPDLEEKQRNGRGELWDKPIENNKKTDQLKKNKKISIINLLLSTFIVAPLKFILLRDKSLVMSTFPDNSIF